jgi:hypothetical protein
MEKTYGFSFLQSVRSRRNGSDTLHDIESTIEEQIASLQDEIASLTKLDRQGLTPSGRKNTHQAAAGYDELLGRSEDLLRNCRTDIFVAQRGARHRAQASDRNNRRCSRLRTGPRPSCPPLGGSMLFPILSLLVGTSVHRTVARTKRNGIFIAIAASSS